MKENAQSDGYVECAECGHAIEQHDRNGCNAVDGCPCPTRWTKSAIAAARRSNGLPGSFDLSRLAG